MTETAYNFQFSNGTITSTLRFYYQLPLELYLLFVIIHVSHVRDISWRCYIFYEIFPQHHFHTLSKVNSHIPLPVARGRK